MAWKEVWNNSYYKIEVEYTMTKNVIANTTTFTAKQIRITSVNSYYSCNNAAGTVGIGVKSDIRGTQTKAINVGDGKSQTIDLYDKTWTIGHNASGTPNNNPVYAHGYCDVGLGGGYHTPAGGWKTAAISVPSIDRSGGSAGIYVSSVSQNAITCVISSNVKTTLGRYRIDGGGWTNFTPSSALAVTDGGSMSKTFSGFSPNTYHTIEVQFRRDYNEVWGTSASTGASTPKPPAPSTGTIKVTAVTINSITVQVSGFGFGGYGATWGAYFFKRSIDGNWSSNGSSATKTFSGLSSGTSYTLQALLQDNYGTNSGVASVTATTLPATPVAGSLSYSGLQFDRFTVSAYGYSIAAGISRFEWQINSGSWASSGTTASKSYTGLKEKTKYTVNCRILDNLGRYSGTFGVTVTTPAEPAGHIFLKTNGRYQRYNIYKKVNGRYIRATDIFCRVNGTYKRDV